MGWEVGGGKGGGDVWNCRVPGKKGWEEGGRRVGKGWKKGGGSAVGGRAGLGAIQLQRGRQRAGAFCESSSMCAWGIL
jgi:hypothetical protein